MTDPFPLAKSDLRGSAQDQKRYKNHKAKWALNPANVAGTSLEFSRRVNTAPHRPLRQRDFSAPGPRRDDRHRFFVTKQTGAQDIHKTEHAKRLERQTLNCTSSSSEEDDANDYDVQHLEDDFIFGVAGEAAEESRDPSSGSQVLNFALDQALAIFEDKETETLVRKEWSVLDDHGEEQQLDLGGHGKKGKRSNAVQTTTSSDEEEYELV